MLILVVAAAVVIAIPLFGGRYSALADLRLRGAWLIPIALALQVLIFTVIELESGPFASTVHLSTYAMIGVCIALNREIAWMWVVGLGWMSNIVVIAANGGVMPTSSAAHDALGRGASGHFENSAPLGNARLEFLGDVFVSPSWLPMQNAYSLGDVLLLAGLGLVVWSASRQERSAEAPGPSSPDAGQGVSSADGNGGATGRTG